MDLHGKQIIIDKKKSITSCVRCGFGGLDELNLCDSLCVGDM